MSTLCLYSHIKIMPYVSYTPPIQSHVSTHFDWYFFDSLTAVYNKYMKSYRCISDMTQDDLGIF